MPRPRSWSTLRFGPSAGSGDLALTTGFVFAGTTPRAFLVRAIGPGLAEYAINGPLLDPALTVFRSDEKLAKNQGWTTHATPEN